MITKPLSKTKPNVGKTERFVSLAGGSALLLWSLLRRSRGSLASAISGGYLLYRGVSGRDPLYHMLDIRRAGKAGIEVRESITINRPREAVYAFWRNFENLPMFMEHLKDVRVLDDRRSYWEAAAPLDQTVFWYAEIIQELVDERISWRSLPDSTLKTAGSVEFRDAPRDYGTEVHVSLAYEPPMGSAGALFARLFGEEPSQQVRADLRHLKQIMETGTVFTTQGQSSGRVKQVEKERAMNKQEEIK